MRVGGRDRGGRGWARPSTSRRSPSNPSRTWARASSPFSASSIRPGRPRAKRSFERPSPPPPRRAQGHELETGLHGAQIPQLPALVLEPDRLALRHVDGVDGPRLPGLRPDQVPGLPRPGRLRHRRPDLAVHALRGRHRRPRVAPDPAHDHPDGHDGPGLRPGRADLPPLGPAVARPGPGVLSGNGQRLRGPGPPVLRPGDGGRRGHDQRHRPELGHVQHGHGRRPDGRWACLRLFRPGLVLRRQRPVLRRRPRRFEKDEARAVRAPAGPERPRGPTSRKGWPTFPATR